VAHRPVTEDHRRLLSDPWDIFWEERRPTRARSLCSASPRRRFAHGACCARATRDIKHEDPA
jgi:hypothetical protein